MAQSIKNLPAMQETWVQSLGRKDPLEKEMAACSSILAWEIPRTESLMGHSSQGRKESVLSTHDESQKAAGNPGQNEREMSVAFSEYLACE